MIGKTVRVWHRTMTGRDSMGEPIYVWGHEDVSNVLVRPLTGSEPSSNDTTSLLRSDGVRVQFRLAFPKTYTGSLRHARVSLVDEPWNMDAFDDALLVSGDPQKEDPCPTQWDTLVEVGRFDG